jgi:hypothetical protein
MLPLPNTLTYCGKESITKQSVFAKQNCNRTIENLPPNMPPYNDTVSVTKQSVFAKKKYYYHGKTGAPPRALLLLAFMFWVTSPHSLDPITMRPARAGSPQCTVIAISSPHCTSIRVCGQLVHIYKCGLNTHIWIQARASSCWTDRQPYLELALPVRSHPGWLLTRGP